MHRVCAPSARMAEVAIPSGGPCLQGGAHTGPEQEKHHDCGFSQGRAGGHKVQPGFCFGPKPCQWEVPSLGFSSDPIKGVLSLPHLTEETLIKPVPAATVETESK